MSRTLRSAKAKNGPSEQGQLLAVRGAPRGAAERGVEDTPNSAHVPASTPAGGVEPEKGSINKKFKNQKNKNTNALEASITGAQTSSLTHRDYRLAIAGEVGGDSEPSAVEDDAESIPAPRDDFPRTIANANMASRTAQASPHKVRFAPDEIAPERRESFTPASTGASPHTRPTYASMLMAKPAPKTRRDEANRFVTLKADKSVIQFSPEINKQGDRTLTFLDYKGDQSDGESDDESHSSSYTPPQAQGSEQQMEDSDSDSEEKDATGIPYRLLAHIDPEEADVLRGSATVLLPDNYKAMTSDQQEEWHRKHTNVPPVPPHLWMDVLKCMREDDSGRGPLTIWIDMLHRNAELYRPELTGGLLSDIYPGSDEVHESTNPMLQQEDSEQEPMSESDTDDFDPETREEHQSDEESEDGDAFITQRNTEAAIAASEAQSALHQPAEKACPSCAAKAQGATERRRLARGHVCFACTDAATLTKPMSPGNPVAERILNQPTQRLMAMIKAPRNEHKMPTPPAPEVPQAIQLHQVEQRQFTKMKQERVEHEGDFIDFRSRAQPTQRPDQPRQEKAAGGQFFHGGPRPPTPNFGSQKSPPAKSEPKAPTGADTEAISPKRNMRGEERTEYYYTIAVTFDGLNHMESQVTPRIIVTDSNPHPTSYDDEEPAPGNFRFPYQHVSQKEYEAYKERMLPFLETSIDYPHPATLNSAEIPEIPIYPKWTALRNLMPARRLLDRMFDAQQAVSDDTKVTVFDEAIEWSTEGTRLVVQAFQVSIRRATGSGMFPEPLVRLLDSRLRNDHIVSWPNEEEQDEDSIAPLRHRLWAVGYETMHYLVQQSWALNPVGMVGSTEIAKFTQDDMRFRVEPLTRTWEEDNDAVTLVIAFQDYPFSESADHGDRQVHPREMNILIQTYQNDGAYPVNQRSNSWQLPMARYNPRQATWNGDDVEDARRQAYRALTGNTFPYDEPVPENIKEQMPAFITGGHVAQFGTGGNSSRRFVRFVTMKLPENFQYNLRSYQMLPLDRLMSLNRATVRMTPEHTQRFYPGTGRVSTEFFLPLDIIQLAAEIHVASINERFEIIRRTARNRKRIDDEPTRRTPRYPDDDEDPDDDSNDHAQSPMSPPTKRMAKGQTPTGSPSTPAHAIDGIQLANLVNVQGERWDQFASIMKFQVESQNKIMQHHMESTQQLHKQSQRMHEDHMQNQTRMMAAMESQAKVVTPESSAGVDTSSVAGALAALLGNSKGEATDETDSSDNTVVRLIIKIADEIKMPRAYDPPRGTTIHAIYEPGFDQGTQIPMAVEFALALQRIAHAREEQAFRGIRPIWRIGQCVDEVTASLWLGTKGVAEILNKGPNPSRHDLSQAPDEVVMTIMAHIGRATQIGDMARAIAANFVERFLAMTCSIVPHIRLDGLGNLQLEELVSFKTQFCKWGNHVIYIDFILHSRCQPMYKPPIFSKHEDSDPAVPRATTKSLYLCSSSASSCSLTILSTLSRTR